MTDSNCISYQNKLYEYLLPSPVLLKKLCMSYDKTELFIISVIRLIVFIILLKSTHNYKYVRVILYIIILLNLIYLIIIITKTPVLSVGKDKSILGLD